MCIRDRFGSDAWAEVPYSRVAITTDTATITGPARVMAEAQDGLVAATVSPAALERAFDWAEVAMPEDPAKGKAAEAPETPQQAQKRAVSVASRVAKLFGRDKAREAPTEARKGE